MLSPFQLLTMGCISSKFVARTLSLHEERNKGLQRKASKSGFPLLEDIIKSAQSSSDQYFELVLHSRSFGSNTPSKLTAKDETDTSETSANCNSEKSTSIEEYNEQGRHKVFTDDQIEGSEGFHLIVPEHVLSSLVQENSYGNETKCEMANAEFISRTERSGESNSHLDPKTTVENKYELSSKGDVGNRSFHTVEEYDDLVRKVMLSKSLWFTQKDDDTCSSESTIDHVEDKDIVQSKTVGPSETHDELSMEKGCKRKAIARRLESLKIPPLPNIYAPGSYVTPKFGSYPSLVAAGSEDHSSIFSPELVSELEQSMMILEEEEDNILKDMESTQENDEKIVLETQERHP